MKPPTIPEKLRRFRAPRASRHRERGVTMVLVAIAMIAIIAMAALSIDVITLYLAREEAQRAADAAALAAARVISMSGLTGDTANTSWSLVCGGASSPATQAAIGVGMQSSVGGTVATTTTVKYSTGGTPVPDCSSLTAAFAINPIVTVQVQRTSLPTFFSRIWGSTGNSISATAVAEAYNPSNSGSIAGGTIIPVQPSCVKPWMIPNQDPLNPPPPGKSTNFCNTKAVPCSPLVGQPDGSIQNPGITLNGSTSSTGVIGETFWLVPGCQYAGSPSGPCAPLTTNPQANYTPSPVVVQFKPPPNLLYAPGQALYASTAVPSCANVGSGGSLNYEPAIGGCDQSTLYQCGVQNTAGNPPMVDLSENLGLSGDVTNGVQCLIGEGAPSDPPPNGQDTFDNYAAPSTYPFPILAGINNPVGLTNGTLTTNSNSIVSLPIYDSPPTFSLSPTGTTSVTIVGFLQVFINAVDPYGNMQVTVLNVAGCGNGSGGAVSPNPITGTSPVPIRLITPP